MIIVSSFLFLLCTILSFVIYEHKTNSQVSQRGSRTRVANKINKKALTNFQHNVALVKHATVMKKNVHEYEETVKLKEEFIEIKKVKSQSRLAKRLEARKHINSAMDNAKTKVRSLGRSKLDQLMTVLELESDTTFLDGNKVLTIFSKLEVEQPEQVLLALSRGNGGHIVKKYFMNWTFTKLKVRDQSNITQASEKQGSAESVVAKSKAPNSQVVDYGKAVLAKFGSTLGHEKISTIVDSLDKDGSGKLCRDKLINLMTKMNMKAPDIVADALFGNKDVDRGIFFEMLGLQDRQQKVKKVATKNRIIRRMSVGHEKLLQYGKDALLKVGQTYGREKMEVLTQTLQEDDVSNSAAESKTAMTTLNRHKIVDLFGKLKLEHPQHLINCLAGSSGEITSLDFLSWCGFDDSGTNVSEMEKKQEEKKEEKKAGVEKKDGVKKVVETKAVETKVVDEKKVDEKKVDEKKEAEKKVDEKKVDEKKVNEKKEAEKKVDEKNVDEQNIDKKNVDEKNVDEKNVDEKKVIEKKTIDTTPIEDDVATKAKKAADDVATKAKKVADDVAQKAQKAANDAATKAKKAADDVAEKAKKASVTAKKTADDVAAKKTADDAAAKKTTAAKKEVQKEEVKKSGKEQEKVAALPPSIDPAESARLVVQKKAGNAKRLDAVFGKLTSNKSVGMIKQEFNKFVAWTHKQEQQTCPTQDVLNQMWNSVRGVGATAVAIDINTLQTWLFAKKGKTAAISADNTSAPARSTMRSTAL